MLCCVPYTYPPLPCCVTHTYPPLPCCVPHTYPPLPCCVPHHCLAVRPTPTHHCCAVCPTPTHHHQRLQELLLEGAPCASAGTSTGPDPDGPAGVIRPVEGEGEEGPTAVSSSHSQASQRDSRDSRDSRSSSGNGSSGNGGGGGSGSMSSSSSCGGRTLNILDCGCGSSHLTFGTYHYLQNVCGARVQLEGVDVNAKLMDRSNSYCQELGECCYCVMHVCVWGGGGGGGDARVNLTYPSIVYP